MGVALHHALIHERAGVTLVAVAHDVLHRLLRVAPHALPLAPRREAAAAAPTQSGIGDLPAYLLTGHGEQCLFKGGIAAQRQILRHILRVGLAAVLQHHPMLVFVKGNVIPALIGHTVLGIQQPLNDLAAQDRLFDDLVAVLHLHMGIENVQRLDAHQRADLAEAMAAGLLQVDSLLTGLVLQTYRHRNAAGLACGSQVIVYLHGAAGDTARTGAHQHIQPAPALLHQLCRLCMQRMEPASRQLAHTAASLPLMASSSPMAASGVILANTSPSMVIVGARPQAPRQATVSSVNTPSALVLRLPSSFRYS